MGCDIIVPRGDRQRVELTVEDDDGNTVDLTLVDDVRLKVSHEPSHISGRGASNEVLDLAGKNLSANGTVDFIINKADTEDLAVKNYKYEVLVDFSGSEQYHALTVGEFFVKPTAEAS